MKWLFPLALTAFQGEMTFCVWSAGRRNSSLSPNVIQVMWSSTSWSQRAFGWSASSDRIQASFFSVGLVPFCGKSIKSNTSDAFLLPTVFKDLTQEEFLISLSISLQGPRLKSKLLAESLQKANLAAQVDMREFTSEILHVRLEELNVKCFPSVLLLCNH